jgi:glycosyltransferase involved in cell wall biosynthesis
MNICMVLADVDFPPDIRVEKEARSLISAGHRVLVICAWKEERPARSEQNGVVIRRIAPLPFFFRKINSLVYLLFLQDLQWRRAIRKIVRTEAIDVVHVHDLPKVGTALRAARGERVRIIADLHENYPALVKLASIHRRPAFSERLLGASRWRRLETRWAKRCDHIIVVAEEAKERLAKEGIPPGKITIVENTVDVRHFLSIPLKREIMEPFRDSFVVSYVGGFSYHRGLDTAVRAMPMILGHIPNAKLLLVGDGEAMPKLRSLVQLLGLGNRVVFTGWQDRKNVPSYIAASDVCLVPHLSTEHTEATVPHKLYDYMVMGKPVVVSSCRPLQRIVEGAACGFVFEAGNAGSLATCILKLKDPELRKRLGHAGKEAAHGRHSWEATSGRLLGLYLGAGGLRK